MAFNCKLMLTEHHHSKMQYKMCTTTQRGFLIINPHTKEYEADKMTVLLGTMVRNTSQQLLIHQKITLSLSIKDFIITLSSSLSLVYGAE